MTLTEKVLSNLTGNVLSELRRTDRLWQALREDTAAVVPVITVSEASLDVVDWDVVICGGTLGIFLGAALAQQGWRIALMERFQLRGREQEWNISRKEIEVLVELGLLTQAELEQAIVTQYNPARIAFHQGPELWVRDVLNLGIDPVLLLATLKTKFLAVGGCLLEYTPFASAIVHTNGVLVKGTSPDIGSSPKSRGGLSTRLLIDAMGHFSPIVRQGRQGQQPDGVCLVVGSCAQGFSRNDSGDLLVSFTPLRQQCQYFWEAFPARDGRTTYLFTYLDADLRRFSLETLFKEYLNLLPEYQAIKLSQLRFQRALFGLFPSYRASPLQSNWHRILQVGDSSGNQSPLSFGGFGAMMRHLCRLTQGICDALQQDLLDRQALSLLQPYQPNLSVTWLFQRAMSVSVEQQVSPEQINQLLSTVFEVMARSGDKTLKPFLQDVVQFSPLSQTLLQVAVTHPGLVAKIIPHVGLESLLDWIGHYFQLGAYSIAAPMSQLIEPLVATLSPTQQYYWRRWAESWQYGSGGDF